MTMPLPVIARIRQAARSGDTQRAWQMFEDAGLVAASEPDVLSLQGRLLKDRGLKAIGAKRARLLDRAVVAYLAANAGGSATYPLINAATTAFLNDQPARAEALARQTLELLDSGSHEPETPYWLAATRAEAALLLGDPAAARAALDEAIAVAPAAWEDRAATLRQLEAILAHAHWPTDLLEPLRPPPSMHFSGLIGLARDDIETVSQIEQVLQQAGPGFVYGALAAGTDIVIAERAVAAGAELHVVLPTTVEAFLSQSVEPYGGGWKARFERLMAAAVEVEAPLEPFRLSRAHIMLSEDIAMGLTIRRARVLASRPLALRVRREDDPSPASDRLWQQRGRMLHRVITRRSEAFDAIAEGDAVQAVLAFAGPVIADARAPDLPMGARGTATLLTVPDLAAATDFALAQIKARPDLQVGLDFRVIVEGSEASLAEAADIARQLAQAAPAGAILAACPGALALELHAPDHPFEGAGEIATPIGNIAVSIHQ